MVINASMMTVKIIAQSLFSPNRYSKSTSNDGISKKDSIGETKNIPDKIPIIK